MLFVMLLVPGPVGSGSRAHPARARSDPQANDHGGNLHELHTDVTQHDLRRCNHEAISARRKPSSAAIARIDSDEPWSPADEP